MQAGGLLYRTKTALASTKNSARSLLGLSVLLAACVSNQTVVSRTDQAKNAWTIEALAAALASPSRPQADRDRDVDRKPAELMTFFGVERGMTALDLLASGGFMTEVLSVTVGPDGKVYAENPTAFLRPFGKAMDERLANNRLSNVERLDGNQAAPLPNSIDFVITVMNLHDIYNTGGPVAQAMKYVYDALKPGGVFGIVDHVGVTDADNAKLHRMTKQQAVDLAKTAGFVLDGESAVLERPSDDHTKRVDDPSIRGKTDQFVLKFRKPSASEVSLTRLDCGNTLGPADMAQYSDTYAYENFKLQLTLSCYLIRHGDDYMLWDAGNPATSPTVKTSLVDQLAQLKLNPEQIKYLAISHYHADHTGQASSFPKSILLIGKGDWDVLTSATPTEMANTAPFANWISGVGTVEPVFADKDIFGDGTVVMLDTPGHTPGHHSLLVRLKEKGNVLISGDLVQFRENYQSNGMPPFNTSRAETLASLDRFKKIAANLKATVIIQHDARDIAKLPVFPAAAK